nr:PREDICTED: olfactomedin-4-like isoform X2 [Latimeria chalumnae]|eukprot:XP_005987920.1 PREDICTED: olfactomedin-4-like isoform X2 [Latimeria chalumnae]
MIFPKSSTFFHREKRAKVTYNETGSLDEGGSCVCSITLPNNVFPVERMEYLEIYSRELNFTFHQELLKVQKYERSITLYAQKLKNLTQTVDVIQYGRASISELDFEVLRVEIYEMESLVLQLRTSLGSSNTIVEKLYLEIKNISAIVTQLESYDQTNVLAVRREINTLRKRLQDCEVEANPTLRHPYGSCDHGGLLDVSKPLIVQTNWRGISYTYGTWGRDPYPAPNKKEVYWVAPLATDGRVLEYIGLFASYSDLLLYRSSSTIRLRYGFYRSYGDFGDGSGMTMYNNSLYYNCYNSKYICRVNVDTNKLERRALTAAGNNNRFSYAGVRYQDMDFEVDESGVWVIYATEESRGNMVISKINSTYFTVEKTWVTTQYKPGVTNAFVICGVLYATRALSTSREEIFYMFDTKTGKEGSISIMIDKKLETIQSLNYSPADHKLYMFNNGYEVTYNVIFKPQTTEAKK